MLCWKHLDVCCLSPGELSVLNALAPEDDEDPPVRHPVCVRYAAVPADLSKLVCPATCSIC